VSRRSKAEHLDAKYAQVVGTVAHLELCHGRLGWDRSASGPVVISLGGQYPLRGSRLRRPPLLPSEFVQPACLDSITHPSDGQDHSAYIPDHGNRQVTARTVQGMARVRSGQALAWPLSSDRSVRRGFRIKRDFACTFTRLFHLCWLSCGHSHA